MYRITTLSGIELGSVEQVRYIKKAESGALIQTTSLEAQGIAFRGVAYNLHGRLGIDAPETVILSSFDSGETMEKLRRENTRLKSANSFLESQITFLEDCILDLADEVYAE